MMLWRRRVAAAALFALIFQPLLPIALAHANGIDGESGSEASLEADLLFTCLTGQSATSGSGDGPKSIDAPSCPWCLSKSAAKALALAPTPAGLLPPSEGERLHYSQTLFSAPGAQWATDAKPRAPPLSI